MCKIVVPEVCIYNRVNNFKCKRKFILLSSLLVFVFVLFKSNKSNGQDVKGDFNERQIEWEKTENYLEFKMKGDVVWRLNYDDEKDKPYFYPLRTTGEMDLALDRPPDHPWHRGLWFSWRDINGINYWEENKKTGLSPGRTIIDSVACNIKENNVAKINFDINYSPKSRLISPEESDVVVSEDRNITIYPPTEDGNYRIDMTLKFTAKIDTVTLGRVVPKKHGGKRWGGYAGLGFRADHTQMDSITYIDSNGWMGKSDTTGYGKRAKWMDMSATSLGKKEGSGGVTIFDHPSNPRHPSPWYIWYKKGSHAFFMPAFLFNKKYTFYKGESFTLQYRVLVHEGEESPKFLKSEYNSYIN